MITLRKYAILVHRYLGVLLGGLFIIWFASGIGMMYARGMPSLTPELRLQRMTDLDLSQIRLTPQEAGGRAALVDPGGVTLLSVRGRPAYRFSGQPSATVFADDGTLLGDIDRATALELATTFMDVGRGRAEYDSFVTEPDQWTLTVAGELPLHKVNIDDESRTELYVSPVTGEIEMLTTRGSRALAWVAAIPHWLYFTPLRVRQELWTQTILWTAGIGCLLAVIGIVLGIWQFRFAGPYRLTDIASHIPYTGWMRWHYLTGVVFGVFTLTWVFSGLLSMEPFGWAAGGGLSPAPLQRALTGGELGLGEFPPIEPARWRYLTDAQSVKEVEYSRIQGAPYFILDTVGGDSPGQTNRILVDAKTMETRDQPFGPASLIGIVTETYPDTTVLDYQVLTEYDSYYYDRDLKAPLPVLRVKFDDPDQTWFYIDPTSSQLLGSVHSRDRIERWIYNGFHSLDFAFWYYNRPLWEFGVIVLSLGGLATSSIGLYLGLRRLVRATRALAS